MKGIISRMARSAKRRLQRTARRCEDGKLRVRYLIVVNLAQGVSPSVIARILHVSRTTVYATAGRFEEFGEAGLIDRREENGQRKLEEKYLAVLYEVVASNPHEHGWKRPTWTQEMLIETLRQKTGVRVSIGTMSKALRQIGARRGKPKPVVNCPWSSRAKNLRLRRIQQLLDNLPPDEVAFYEDEVDIHLNPKIGQDWMVCGQQKEVLTPGKNEKRYLAGAQNAHADELIWVERERKNSPLFILLLWELVERHPEAKVIHVILDNYSIHHTQQVKTILETEHGQRIKLHFLPPYCPDHNKIERTWQDLHANVTRNHRCATINDLMRNVRRYLRQRNRNNRHEKNNAIAA